MQDSEKLRAADLGSPHISVVIPVRNAADTLAETLTSLARQTYSDFEAIIVDDGSDDGTDTIIRAWMKSDPRIRALPQPPSGVSVARNNGLRAALGTWVLFLDGDDWLVPDYFTRMLARSAEQPKAEAVYCGYRRVPPDGAVLPTVYDPQLETLPLKSFAACCAVCIHGIMVRRELLLEAGGFDTSLKTSEDWDLWIRLARMGTKFAGIPDPLALYRIRPGSASSRAVEMAKNYQAVVRRAHAPDPRVKRGPQRYQNGWPDNDIGALSASNLTYLAATEAGNGKDGAIVFDALEFSPNCTGIIDDLCQTLVDGLTVGAGHPASRLTDEIGPQVTRIAERIEQLCPGTPAAEYIMRRTASIVLADQDITEPKSLWGTYALALDLCHPFPDIAIPAGTHQILVRLRYRGRDIETFCFRERGIETAEELAKRLLEDIGFYPGTRGGRLAKLLMLPWLFAAMVSNSAGKIWRSKRQRKQKYIELVRNLYPTFRICGSLYLAARGPAASRLADPKRSALQVERCRADIFGSFDFGVHALPPAHGQRHTLARALGPSPVKVPVLMYHRIATDGPAQLAQWRLAPSRFEEQLKLLRREGFSTITSHELAAAMRGERALRPRSVMLTFDDAYCDFYDAAYPLLQRYAATAELFVVTGKVGGAADWDQEYGAPAPLMGWPEIQEVSRNGIAIGSHMVSHRRSTSLDDYDLVEEAAISRFTLEGRIALPVRSLALPFGDFDQRVIEAMGLCGYECVYTCEGALASSDGSLLQIPRLEVTGDTDLSSFARMLGLTAQKETVFA